MNPEQPPPSERELEALSRQLRALAQHLVRDPGAADDLVQEAWLAALNRPREQLAELGAWLRVVVRNLAARRVRRELRRQDAELLRAEREETRETEELLERSNIALALREAAHELPEPVRSVIVLHYFEGLTLEATAVRLARPLETVRSQRRRGIEALRAVLDRRHRGARRDWFAALAPLLGQRAARAPGWRWAALAALVSIVIVGLGVRLVRTGPQEAATPALAVLEGSREAPQLSAPLVESLGRGDVASAEPTNDPPSEPAAAPPVETRRFSVRVTDADGRAVAGAKVSALGVERTEQGPFFTDVEGEVEFELALDRLSYRGQFGSRGGLLLYAYADGQARSMVASVLAREEQPQRVEMALRGRAQALVGVVLDPDGQPVERAYIDIENHARVMQHLPEGVSHADDPRSAWSDSQGRFEFRDLPLRTHRWLARGPELGTVTGTVEGEGDELALVINLPRGRVLRGTVTSAGRILPGAQVWVARGFGASIGAPTTTSDAEGRYVLKGISESPLRAFARAAPPDALFADALVVFEDHQQETELDFELEPRPPLRLRFVAGDGAAQVSAMVTVQTQETEPAPWRQSVTTDGDGWAVFDDYASCPLKLQLRPAGAPGYVLARLFDPRLSTTLEVRVSEGPDSSAAPVQVRLVDPHHSPLDARIFAVSTRDRQGVSRAVDARSGAVLDWFVPAGPRWFYAIDGFGASPLGYVSLDGVRAHDFGLHTLGAARGIELVWPAAREGDDTLWSISVVLAECDTSERLVELPHGRSRVELRDGCYLLCGDSPQGVERVRVRFEVGPGQLVRVLVP